MITFIMLVYLWKYEVPLIAGEAFWFNNVIMLLSSLALIYQYKDEKLHIVLPSVIDKNVIKESSFFIMSRGILMGIAAFLSFILGYNKGVEFAQITAFTVLNLNAVFFNYSFSNKLFFQNKISNLIILLNLIVQFGFLVLIGGIRIMLSTAYWKNIVYFCLYGL